MNHAGVLLSDGLTEMSLTATPQHQKMLLEFVLLLRKWNRVYNLTSITDPPDMVRLHLLDSLALLPYMSGRRVLDVGTGAGLPGLPLAIVAEEQEFTLLDSNSKKTRFVQQAVIELGLRNVRVIHSRIESFQESPGFDVILARAFSGLMETVERTRHLLSAGGVILAQKGKAPDMDGSNLQWASIETIRLHIPGVDAERHLVAFKSPG